jgi:hypothetical protein
VTPLLKNGLVEPRREPNAFNRKGAMPSRPAALLAAARTKAAELSCLGFFSLDAGQR